MQDKFFIESKEIRELLRVRILEKTKTIPNSKLRDIISQRHSTSSLLKGVLSYFVHEGVGGNFSEDKKLELASGIEIFCSAGALLDNVIDEHEERNGKTTFLKEYGKNMQLAASQYVLHQGLKILSPFMSRFNEKYSDKYKIEEAIIGMIGMDIESSETLEERIEIVEKSNGTFNSVPLVIAAATGTEDKNKINNVEKYGYNLGAGLAIYEEVRDLLGEHGRKKATEVESGRMIIPFYYAVQKKDFNPKNYLNKELSEKEYGEMMQKLVQNGSLKRSEDLSKTYLNLSQTALRDAVNSEIYQKLNNLTESILNELDELVRTTENRYS